MRGNIISNSCSEYKLYSNIKMDIIKNEVSCLKKSLDELQEQKIKRLQDVDFLVLDNSIRESTVGQIKGHTVENKLEILQQVKKCGYKNIIVATFSHMTRVDDEFVQYLKKTGENFDNLFSFSEVTVGLKKDKTYDTETIPVALTKNMDYGLKNVIFEVDLANDECDWEKFSVNDMFELIKKRVKHVHRKFDDARIIVNLRDLPMAMSEVPERLLTMVQLLSQLPPERRLFALIFEEPSGNVLPEHLAMFTRSVRKVMDANSWSDGKILVHVHEKWGLCNSGTLECIAAGADGMWSSLCEEGAMMGHTCSAVTIMNLVRLGNKKVLERYDCKNLRNAATIVTKVTTNRDPHPKQPVYGARALDIVFDSPMGGGNFDLATFFGVEPMNRITTLASNRMIAERLVNLFGDNPQFTEEMANEMKLKMLEDLRSNRKEEYMSKAGLAILFDRAGGKLTEVMADEISKVKVYNLRHKELLQEVREEWDRWDLRDKVQNDDCLEFDSFYHGFMAPYFGCYRCKRTKKGLQALDMDNDGLVDWKEFSVYLKWALSQYPETESADDLLTIVFEKGLIPAMHDEEVRKSKETSQFGLY